MSADPSSAPVIAATASPVMKRLFMEILKKRCDGSGLHAPRSPNVTRTLENAEPELLVSSDQHASYCGSAAGGKRPAFSPGVALNGQAAAPCACSTWGPLRPDSGAAGKIDAKT